MSYPRQGFGGDSRVTVDPRVLELIVCPQCRGPLSLENILLFCRNCSLEYPIKGGIPVLLIDSATKRQ